MVRHSRYVLFKRKRPRVKNIPGPRDSNKSGRIYSGRSPRSPTRWSRSFFLFWMCNGPSSARRVASGTWAFDQGIKMGTSGQGEEKVSILKVHCKLQLRAFPPSPLHYKTTTLISLNLLFDFSTITVTYHHSPGIPKNQQPPIDTRSNLDLQPATSSVWRDEISSLS